MIAPLTVKQRFHYWKAWAGFEAAYRKIKQESQDNDKTLRMG